MTNCQCRPCVGVDEINTPEAAQFLARAPFLNAYEQLCFARFINRKVEAGIWAQEDVYIWHIGPAALRTTNMRKNAHHATMIGSVPHVPGLGSFGVGGVGTNKFVIDFDPTTAAGAKYKTTSGTLGARRTAVGGGDGGAFIGNGVKANLTFRSDLDTVYSTLNAGGWSGFSAPADTGLVLVSRDGANVHASIDGVPLGAVSSSAVAPTAGNFEFLTDASGTGTTSGYGSMFIGGYLTPGQHRTLAALEANLMRDLLAQSQPVYSVASFDLFNNGLRNVTPDLVRLRDGRFFYAWSMRTATTGGVLHGALSHDGKAFDSTFVIHYPVAPHTDLSECRVAVDPVTGGVLLQISEYHEIAGAYYCDVRLFTAPNPLGGPLVFTMYTMPTTIDSGNALSTTRPSYLRQSERWVTSSYSWGNGSNLVNLQYFELNASMVPTFGAEAVLINGPIVPNDRYNEIEIHEVPDSTEIMIFMRNGDEDNANHPRCGYDICRASADGQPFSQPIRFLASSRPGRPVAAIADDRTVLFLGRAKSADNLDNSTVFAYSVPPVPSASPGLDGTWSAKQDLCTKGAKTIGAYSYAGLVWDPDRSRFVGVIGAGGFSAPSQLIAHEWKREAV